MKTLSLQLTYTQEELNETAKFIMLYLCGNVQADDKMMRLTERNRQFFTWGASEFTLIESADGCRGLQFRVSGLKHKGLVRVWYNPSSDYYDVEILSPDGKECIHEYEDVDFEQLHNLCHSCIERDDDVKV